MSSTVRGFLIVCALGALACGSDADAGGTQLANESDAGNTGTDADTSASGPLVPWKEGNSWTYRVTEDGETSTKVTTIGALEAVGGSGPNAAVMANKVVTKKGDSDQTISWQVDQDDRVVRYREQSFDKDTGALDEEDFWDPPKLHVDGTAAHRVDGAAWVETYQQTEIKDGETETSTERDAWTVDGVDVSVTVPAGTFKAIVFQKAGGSTLKTYWYVPGIGKVKETGGQTEELVSYELVP